MAATRENRILPEDPEAHRNKKYAQKLSIMNNMIYTQFNEFVRLLESQLKHLDITKDYIRNISISVAINPFSEELKLSQTLKNAIHSIFERNLNESSAGQSSLTSTAFKTQADVLVSKRIQLLTSVLKIQKLKRKLNMSKPTSILLQMINWQNK